MFRRFRFEGEPDPELPQIPMTVRHKLDRVGLKVGLEEWESLSLAERLAICHFPSESEEEIAVLAAFLREAVERATGHQPAALDAEKRGAAEPPDAPPEGLVANARAAGFTLDRTSWGPLDDEQRYALMKLGAGKRISHNLRAGLEEFLPRSARRTSSKDAK